MEWWEEAELPDDSPEPPTGQREDLILASLRALGPPAPAPDPQVASVANDLADAVEQALDGAPDPTALAPPLPAETIAELERRSLQVEQRLVLASKVEERLDQEFGPVIKQAHQLHKALLAKRQAWGARLSEARDRARQWLAQAQLALRRHAELDRQRRQAEADKAEAERKRLLAEAAKQSAPLLAEQLAKEAERAVAPPVPIITPAPLAQTQLRTTWKARLGCGCMGDDGTCGDPRAHEDSVRQIAQAALGGRLPVGALRLDWGYLHARARADRQALDVPGVTAVEVPQVATRRGKP